MRDIRIKTIENDLEYLRQISSDVDLKKDDFKVWINDLRTYCHQNNCFAISGVQKLDIDSK